MYLADGRQVSGQGLEATQISDAHGNSVTIQNLDPSSGAPQTILADNLPTPRTIQLQHNFANGTDTITQTGANSHPLTWTVTWQTQAVYGNQTYTNCASRDPNGLCYVPNFSAVTSIAFPQNEDGSVPTYSFGYNTVGFGQLNTVTTPTASRHVRRTFRSIPGEPGGSRESDGPDFLGIESFWS